MSMFYELMMRKKTEYLYPIIKGSLTDEGGVISNFSSSNYLLFRNSITNIQTAEIIIDCTIGSDLNNTGMSVFSSQEWGIQLYKPTNSDTKYKLNLSGSGTSGTHEFSANEHIRVKILVENNYLYIYYYDFSNNDWVLDITYPPNDYTWSQKNKTQLSNIIFGDNQTHSGTRVFTGSIDLNNSYIKIGAMKYNLQAVVGYTVVGSLTESPSGVFSGFVNQTNYLQLKSLTVEQIGTDSEFVSYFNSNNQFFPLFCANSSNVLWIHIRQASIRIKIGDVSAYSFTTSGIDYTQSHKIKVLFKNYNCLLFIDDNLIGNYQFGTPTNLSSSRNINIGSENYIGTSGTAFTGATVDLNNNKTYIKVNNKLWFNGQQA